MTKRKNYDISLDFHHWMETRGFTTDSFELGSYWYGNKDGRYFRALNDYFEIDDGDFDRWANSHGATVDIPWTEEALDCALKNLYVESKRLEKLRLR